MGGWPWWTLSLLFLPSGTQELLNSFPVSLLASSNIIICSLPVCRSKIRQSNQWQSRLASFSFKKWQIFLDNVLLGDSFPAGAKMLCSQPIRLQHSPTAYATSPLLLNYAAKLELRPQLGGEQYLISLGQGWYWGRIKAAKRCVFVFMFVFVFVCVWVCPCKAFRFLVILAHHLKWRYTVYRQRAYFNVLQ